MALCDLHWYSKLLGKHVGAYVFVPDEHKPPLATLYLLHGLTDDYTGWVRRTNIERYALQHAMIIVMPDGFRGFYTDNDQGPPYAQYIAEELVGQIDRLFPTIAARDARGIGGLSMGGYGALRLALGYPRVFAAATSHSGALLSGSRPPRAGSPTEAESLRTFGADPTGSNHDLFTLAERCKLSRTLPNIRIDCGIDDFLIEDNRAAHARLQTLGIPHEYEEFPGNHSWDYWDRHVQDALAFHSRHLTATQS